MLTYQLDGKGGVWARRGTGEPVLIWDGNPADVVSVLQERDALARAKAVLETQVRTLERALERCLAASTGPGYVVPDGRRIKEAPEVEHAYWRGYEDAQAGEDPDPGDGTR